MCEEGFTVVVMLLCGTSYQGWMDEQSVSLPVARGMSDFCINYDHAPSLHLSVSACILLRVFLPLSAIDKCFLPLSAIDKSFLLRHFLFCYCFFWH